MGRIVDTSFLYAAFDAADARHREARDELGKPHALGIPLCIMAEFLDLVEYRNGRQTAAKIHRDLTEFPTVALVGIKDEAAVLVIWARHPGLSVCDAAGIQASIEGKATLLSYDAAQAKALASVVATS